jgi:hypothetical protein
LLLVARLLLIAGLLLVAGLLSVLRRRFFFLLATGKDDGGEDHGNEGAGSSVSHGGLLSA